MGQYMYVYNAHKPTDLKKDIVYDYDDLAVKNYVIFEANQVEGKEQFVDLIPFCEKVRGIVEAYDLKHIAQEFNLGPDTKFHGFGPDGEYFGDGNKEIVILDDEIKKYCVKEEMHLYVTELKQVAYFKNHYKLQQAIHGSFNRKIEKCGYYLLSQETLVVITNYLGSKLEGCEEGTLLYNEE